MAGQILHPSVHSLPVATDGRRRLQLEQFIEVGMTQPHAPAEAVDCPSVAKSILFAHT